MMDQGNPRLTGYHCNRCYEIFEPGELEKLFRKLAEVSSHSFTPKKLPEIRKKVRNFSTIECPNCEYGECFPQIKCHLCGSEVKIFIGTVARGFCDNCDIHHSLPIIHQPGRRAIYRYLSENPGATPREISYHLKIDKSEVLEFLHSKGGDSP